MRCCAETSRAIITHGLRNSCLWFADACVLVMVETIKYYIVV